MGPFTEAYLAPGIGEGDLTSVNEGCSMVDDEAHTIGWALWRVRNKRGKSLRLVAELAGMSKDTLNRN